MYATLFEAAAVRFSVVLGSVVCYLVYKDCLSQYGFGRVLA
jgi:hypothetical protein